MYPTMRRPLAVASAISFLGVVALFFGFHTFAGSIGLLAKNDIMREIMLAREELSGIEKRNSLLRHRIELLRSGKVDPDMLAETARANVGMFSQNDVIVTIPLGKLKF